MTAQKPTSFRWYSRDEIAACQDVLGGARLHNVALKAWTDIASGTAYGMKSTIAISAKELPDHKILKSPATLAERLGWKLSCLSSVNRTYAAVKVVGANALNRRAGLARSTSTILLLDKLTMTPLCAMDATDISAARTASYATIVVERFLKGRDQLSLFLFGAGPVAVKIIMAIDECAGSAVARLLIRSRTADSAERLVARLRAHVSFHLEAAADIEDLNHFDLIITATNARDPVFGPDDIKSGLILHLGGDETPATHLERTIRHGLVLCDSVEMVSRRNSQSLALYFSRKGTTLEQIGPLLGIRSLADFDEPVPESSPIHITCVGLPMLDLYVGAHVYQALLENEGRKISSTVLDEP
jgi:N-[(2S)-2-amino-2-carboxyethyl]-L-glutamate dehydrogenase